MEPLSKANVGQSGCRVIAFDRPPFGLTERPLQWEGGQENSPYGLKVQREDIQLLLLKVHHLCIISSE